MQYFIKILVTTVLVILISEVAKRNQSAGALLASIPTTSIIALTWYYYETGSKTQTAALASDIFLMVVPSLAFFVVLPLMLRRDFSYSMSLAGSSAVTATCYFAFLKLASLIR